MRGDSADNCRIWGRRQQQQQPDVRSQTCALDSSKLALPLLDEQRREYHVNGDGASVGRREARRRSGASSRLSSCRRRTLLEGFTILVVVGWISGVLMAHGTSESYRETRSTQVPCQSSIGKAPLSHCASRSLWGSPSQNGDEGLDSDSKCDSPGLPCRGYEMPLPEWLFKLIPCPACQGVPSSCILVPVAQVCQHFNSSRHEAFPAI